jgi:hypothetical protein
MLKSIGRTLALRTLEETRMADTVKKTKAAAKPKKAEAKPKLVEAKPKIAKAMSKPKTTEIRSVSHEEIEKLAHRFWTERGYQHGEPEIDWFRAEEQLRGKAS